MKESLKIETSRRRLPAVEDVIVDDKTVEVYAELLSTSGGPIWPFKVYTYRIDFRKLTEAVAGYFLTHKGEFPEVRTASGRRIDLNYE